MHVSMFSSSIYTLPNGDCFRTSSLMHSVWRTVILQFPFLRSSRVGDCFYIEKQSLCDQNAVKSPCTIRRAGEATPTPFAATALQRSQV